MPSKSSLDNTHLSMVDVSTTGIDVGSTHGKTRMPRVRTVISLPQHTLLDAPYLKLHLLATRTREHHRTPSYLSEAERLQSHTMLFARNSLVCKHTGYQYTERERTAACLHRQLLCHARKVTFKRHGFRLFLGTEH